jgi:hypothetical protein
MWIGGAASPSMRIVTVVVPVALYFLLLGLLNSRRRPQLLTGRQDFVLLVAALGPLFALPAVEVWGLPALVAAAAAAAAAVVLLAPRGASWVIYNLPAARARDAVAEALDRAQLPARPVADGFDLAAGPRVRLRRFSLLRNVSIRLTGAGREAAGRFEAALADVLGGVRVETSPMAVSLLLVATAMLVAPLALVAHRAGELVRLLTHLIP